MSYPKITVVTPSFNQGRFLEETICSVLDQGYPNLEYIVIDGGSTDESVDVIKKYESNIDKWLSEPDEGQSHAINKGLKLSTGDIECWLNSDDVLLPGSLQRVAKYFEDEKKLGLVIGQRLTMDEKSSPLAVHFQDVVSLFWDMTGFLFYPNQECSFWRRTCREKVGFLREDLHYSMDYDWFLRLSRVAKSQSVPEMLGGFRQYPEQKCVSRDENGEDVFKIRREFLSGLQTPVTFFRIGIRLYRLFRQTFFRRPFTATTVDCEGDWKQMASRFNNNPEYRADLHRQAGQH